jgi:hypothetical protein
MDFWKMTYKEIMVFIEERSKLQLVNNYNLANQVAQFVNLGLNGKPIPSINEIYPGLFEPKNEPVEDNRWMLWKERMIDYAHEYNKRRQLQKEGG